MGKFRVHQIALELARPSNFSIAGDSGITAKNRSVLQPLYNHGRTGESRVVRVLKVIAFVTVLLLLLPAVSADAKDYSQTTFGKCYTVHGRYAIYTDGDAIWPVGTHRLLSTTDPELDKMLEQAGWEDHVLFGDFSVCPDSLYKRGEMQSVCIQAYKNIRVVKRH
jgi:hypothetical protein